MPCNTVTFVPIKFSKFRFSKDLQLENISLIEVTLLVPKDEVSTFIKEKQSLKCNLMKPHYWY